MDSKLHDKLMRLNKAMDTCTEKESIFFQLDASEKSLFAELCLRAEATTVKEREWMALAAPEWKDFKKGLAVANSSYNHARRKVELAQKAADAEYITYKLEKSVINRQGYEQ